MSYLSREESQLLERIKKGEKQAWEEFVDLYARLIYYVIRHTLEKKGRKELLREVDDIFQAFFIHLAEDGARRLINFSGNCSLASWIRILAINFTLDLLKKKTGTHLEVEFKSTIINPSKGSFTPLEALEEREKIEKLEQAVSNLNEDEQEFLQLYLSGFSPSQLAKIYHTSPNNIYTRYARLKEKLKNFLKNM